MNDYCLEEYFQDQSAETKRLFQPLQHNYPFYKYMTAHGDFQIEL